MIGETITPDLMSQKARNCTHIARVLRRSSIERRRPRRGRQGSAVERLSFPDPRHLGPILDGRSRAGKVSIATSTTLSATEIYRQFSASWPANISEARHPTASIHSLMRCSPTLQKAAKCSTWANPRHPWTARVTNAERNMEAINGDQDIPPMAFGAWMPF